MSPATIEVPLGRFIAHVPRSFLVEPLPEVDVKYRRLKNAIKGWRGSLEGIQQYCEQRLPGIIVTTPMQTIRQHNLQLAADIAEASDVNFNE